MGTIKTDDWSYMADGIEAKGHTAIYKMHKYFARRPQNVFAELIKHYSAPGDVILDPFCGGGVSVVEGVSLGRRVAGIDINPLAALITEAEATPVEWSDYEREITQIRDELAAFSNPWYLTINRETGGQLPVRWYELAYTVSCPVCSKTAVLSNENKKTEQGKAKDGWYVCPHCQGEIQAVDAAHTGYELLSVTYKTSTRATQVTVRPEPYDRDLQLRAECELDRREAGHTVTIPPQRIPENWDRQQEDCLHRKGVYRFRDLFTKRTLLVMAHFLELVRARKQSVSPGLYRLLLLTFSATLRYTNNMTFSTASWQDGRPVAWAKHAYWLSNQFIEVNPIEYLDNRIAAFQSALLFQKKKLGGVSSALDAPSFEEGMGDFLVLNQDSSHLPLKDESVDLVLTDPPYGGNVQYGELSAFWLVWLKDDLGLDDGQILGLSDEILIQRKNKVQAKDHQRYCKGLHRVFQECYRVLKKGRPLVFTFNSKDTKVWIAVIKAALDAGFILEPAGVIYQSPIENYRNTAHAKSAGTVHGDFIYTFVKPLAPERTALPENTELLDGSIERAIAESVRRIFAEPGASKTTSEIYIYVLKSIMPLLVKLVVSDRSYDFTQKVLSGAAIENAIKRICVWNTETSSWTLCGGEAD